MSRVPQADTETRLLDVAALRHEYGLGRETAYGLTRLLPCVRVGARYLIRRDDLEAYLERAAREGRDIRREALAAARAAKNPAGAGGGR
ncbi:Helix-turn-helix domain protein [Calidithermus terrae]|uniref:Helix-turn-helix domain protein n=1 Tax=Calidithermus terrae TaxID=1408545 RepID=A0A399EKL9_9DEIN|nr:helix-turn-helix domain-containing protein [Calidithermus terrae]RIH84003.1 Helix-turn-helix domain protein [Calidithermus terrae]